MSFRGISHYRIIKEPGEGRAGNVYLAEDTRLGRRVAIKFLPASYQDDPERRTRFLADARAASALNSPHIAAILDIGEHEGSMYVVMEYVEGELLSEKLKRGPMAIRDAIDIATQIADALSEVHSLGIVHRDIKAANVIINDRGIIKLLDFGIAAATLSSPEQAIGRAIDHRSDIFSLGVVLYQMLTGRLPFEGDTPVEIIDNIIHAEPIPVQRINHAVPAELDRIVRKCLEKVRERRYQSVRDFLTDLRNLHRHDSASPAERLSLDPLSQLFVSESPSRQESVGPLPDLLNAVLDGPFALTARPQPVPGDLRLRWGIALVVLILGKSRGKRASVQKLHFLAHSIRSQQTRSEAQQVFSGTLRPADILIRFEPWLNRALGFAKASGLIEIERGKSARLVERGLLVLEALYEDDTVFADEKGFLASVGILATESAVDKIMKMELTL